MKVIAMAVMASIALAASGAAGAQEALAKSEGCFNCHAVDTKKVGPAFKDVAAKYKGKADARERITFHITSDVANFTTLRLVNGGVNRGKILLDGGRVDRGTRLLAENFNTNLPSGRIEVILGPGGARNFEGTLVNQGAIICTNSPAEFRGTFQSDGGVIEGDAGGGPGLHHLR